MRRLEATKLMLPHLACVSTVCKHDKTSNINISSGSFLDYKKETLWTIFNCVDIVSCLEICESNKTWFR